MRAEDEEETRWRRQGREPGWRWPEERLLGADELEAEEARGRAEDGVGRSYRGWSGTTRAGSRGGTRSGARAAEPGRGRGRAAARAGGTGRRNEVEVVATGEERRRSRQWPEEKRGAGAWCEMKKERMREEKKKE